MSDTTLGELLVVLGVITYEQRHVAGEAQRMSSRPMTFGEILVALNFCSQEQVDEAAELQGRLRSKQARERAEATHDVALRSKEVLGTARKQLVAAGKAIIQKIGTDDIPTPMLGTSILGG